MRASLVSMRGCGAKSTAGLTVWGRVNSVNVQKVLLAIGELGTPHERIDAGMHFGVNDSAEYRDMNPTGKIPTICDDGTVVYESNVIVRYVAAKYGAGTLWPQDPAARARADVFMDLEQTTFASDMRTCFWNMVRTKPELRDMANVRDAAERLGGEFKKLDALLASQPFLAGATFTMGDIPIGCHANRYFQLPIERPPLPNVEAWYARLKERPAYAANVSGIPMS